MLGSSGDRCDEIRDTLLRNKFSHEERDEILLITLPFLPQCQTSFSVLARLFSKPLIIYKVWHEKHLLCRHSVICQIFAIALANVKKAIKLLKHSRINDPLNE